MEIIKRQSNIELCRLVSILLVMILHTTTQSVGHVNSFTILLLKAFTIIGVNVFVLITGFFSTELKKKSLINLAFICFFWMLVKIFCRLLCGESIGLGNLFFITTSNWFIVSYLGLLLLTPILNNFSERVSKKKLWVVCLLLVLYEVWFDVLPPYPAVRIGAQGGYSVLSFAIIYLIGRAISIHGLPLSFKRLSLWIYVICSFLIACCAYVIYQTGLINFAELLFSYSNPIIILSSVAFLEFFKGLKFESITVNYIAKSTLACLLGHSAIFFLYTKQFKYLYENITGIELVLYWSMSIAMVFIGSIVIDQIRLFLWKPMNNWLSTHIKDNNIFNYGL